MRELLSTEHLLLPTKHYTGLFEMIVVDLISGHTQYT